MQNDPQTPADMPRSQDPHTLESGAMEVNPLGTPVPDGGMSRPAGVYVVSAVVGLEALALGILAGFSIFSALTQPTFSMASAVFLIVLLLALAVGLGAVAVNAFRGFRWTRSAAFVWQLLMVAIAMPTLAEGNVLLGIVLLVPPLAAAFFLFTPKVVAFSLRTGDENNVL